VSGAEAARLLRDRADSYARDAEAIGRRDLEAWATLITVRDELRKVADQIETRECEAAERKAAVQRAWDVKMTMAEIRRRSA
jgi:hypothetical protein